MKKMICLTAMCLLVMMGCTLTGCNHTKVYQEISSPTPNITQGKSNQVQGVILHHTASSDAKNAIRKLTLAGSNVSSHVVIDTDGTRWVLASPEQITWHAGKSILNGRENCNDFTIGIEFQGNTLETELTQDQINSAIDYLLPLIDKYKIPMQNIVTHETIRTAYKRAHPNDTACLPKRDITSKEYTKFMKALKAAQQKRH